MPLRDVAIMELFYSSGLRLSELVGLDIDDVVEGDHRVTLGLSDATTLELRGLGSTHDQFLDELRTARRASRLPALTVATGAPIRSFLSRDPSGEIDVHVFAKVLVIEPRSGRPDAVPLPLVVDLRRDGHTIAIHCRGRADVTVKALGSRTDEFVDVLERAMVDLRAATAAAYTALDPSLDGCTAPDGWAFTASERPREWEALAALASTGERASCMQLLRDISGDDVALGVHTDGGGEGMPFALVRVGGRIAVEAFTADDRATFVFEQADREALNAVLLLTSFRREALSLPEAFPARDLMLVTAFVAILVPVLVQGTSLGWVIRRASPREDPASPSIVASRLE